MASCRHISLEVRNFLSISVPIGNQAMNHVGLHCKRNKKHQRALISVMWIVYAAFASLSWGVSYAACGPLLKKGLNPLIFLLGYSLCGLIGSLIALLTSTKQSGEMSFGSVCIGGLFDLCGDGGKESLLGLIDRDFVSAFCHSFYLGIFQRNAAESCHVRRRPPGSGRRGGDHSRRAVKVT